MLSSRLTAVQLDSGCSWYGHGNRHNPVFAFAMIFKKIRSMKGGLTAPVEGIDKDTALRSAANAPNWLRKFMAQIELDLQPSALANVQAGVACMLNDLLLRWCRIALPAVHIAGGMLASGAVSTKPLYHSAVCQYCR
jgi:hypothetical protein